MLQYYCNYYDDYDCNYCIIIYSYATIITL